ncbi:RDD family protein [Natrinema caseinilyticum]|uniref:RDD family protein n=1 Tax=Natrinema caseinilyticum TaxID=2961570 RepID=UPI0020C4134F|nr:RDD family protein [Natrinema caseinilyticum]
MEETDHPQYCGIGIRGVAIGIDSFVWIALLFVAIFITAAFTGQLETGSPGLNAELSGAPASMALGLWFVLALGYHTVFEWRFGKTIGKALVNIRVTSEDGSSLTFTSSLIRNAMRFVDWLPALYLIGIVGIAVSGQRKRLGDRVAGTAVVGS